MVSHFIKRKPTSRIQQTLPILAKKFEGSSLEEINALLEKYDHFKDASFRSVRVPVEGEIIVTLVLQDDDGEDLNDVVFTLKGVQNSVVLENSILAYLDMMQGISIVYERERYGFGLGRWQNMLGVTSAPLYIVATEITFEERD
jgi:hypothetical protein